MIINAGIVRVVCAEEYPDELGRSMLAEAGIVLELWYRPLTKTQTVLQEDR